MRKARFFSGVLCALVLLVLVTLAGPAVAGETGSISGKVSGSLRGFGRAASSTCWIA